MRNLVVVRDASGEIDLAPLPSGGERVVASCVDPENGIMYAATDACNVYGMSAGDGWKVRSHTPHWAVAASLPLGSHPL